MTEDFCGADLRGRSFKNLDLTGRDFSDADIRGAKFDQTNLTNVNFSQVKAGLPSYWIFIWNSVSYLLLILTGFFYFLSSWIVTQTFTSNNTQELEEIFSNLSGFFILITLAGFLFIYVNQGIIEALKKIAFILGIALPVAVIFDSIKGQFAFIPALIIFLPLSVVMLLLGTGIGAIAVKLTDTIFEKFKQRVVVTWIIIFISGVVLSVLLKQEPLELIIPIAIIEILCLFVYLNYKTTKKGKELAGIKRIVVAVVAKSGTSFRGTDLTNANFTEATLENTDFRNATLTQSCWLHARKLDYACVEGTYLQEEDIQQLVLTNNGQNKNFDRRNLSGLNLQAANLSEASFIEANLSQANLRQANLYGAKLVQTQLYRADLRKSCLTGAYIQDWGISIETKLEEIKCKYIYMHLPTKDDPDPYRKPDNKKEFFKAGDFSDFIAPIIKTLDLYRSQYVDTRELASTFKTLDLFYSEGIDDPGAAVLALQQLAEKYPEAGIEVLALEGRGNEKIRIQAKVTGTANRSELSAEYFDNYRQIKNLFEQNPDSLITGMVGQSQEIQWLRRMIEVAINQDKFYIENVHNSRKIEISGGTVNATGSGAFSLGNINGAVANAINQLPNSPKPDELGIKELLTQLQETIENSSDLNNEDKTEALEQIEILAEASKNSQEKDKKKAAKTAIKILRGTVSNLPDASKLVERCAKLLPAISKLLLF